MNFNPEYSDKVFENKKRAAEEYSEIALEIRRDIIKSLALAKSGHSGGSLGITDIMTVLYFGGYLNYNTNDLQNPLRDKFVLSAGHLAPVLYSALARAGFFPIEDLRGLRKLGSKLQGHPAYDMDLPGIESSTGSLGHGISIAVGMAMAAKLIDKTNQHIYCLTGDGELQEGLVWEAAMCAGNYKLDNLCWIVDNNDCQIDGRVKDVMSIYPLEDKFKSFGFNVINMDGHDFQQIMDSFDTFKSFMESGNGKPTVIIAKTFMGKGVSFMEDKYEWHGNPPNVEQAIIALKDLGEDYKERL
jgi:transketolase